VTYDSGIPPDARSPFASSLGGPHGADGGTPVLTLRDGRIIV
jgi:hypothetical protein